MKATRVALAFMWLAFASNASGITVTDLRCEYQVQPLAIDTSRPRLTWVMHSAERGADVAGYHILVASSRALLDQDTGNLWDARISYVQFPVEYQGKPLQSGQVCFWKVSVFDGHAIAGPWSESARWEMGILLPSDWKAVWINDGKPNTTKEADFYKDDPAPLFRKCFEIAGRIARARLAITGLGYYSVRINGQPVSDQQLGPAWSRYSKRVFYTVFDVSDKLQPGSNCIGVTLGNGWYNPLPMRMFGSYNLRESLPVGRPRFIAQLDIELSNGTHQQVLSDRTWKVADGPLRFNSLYLGERYDARCELPGWDSPGYDDKSWRAPGLANEPIGKLECQSQPPIRITRRLPTAYITEPHPGTYIFDLGKNFAGWIELRVSQPSGTRITLRYGELLNKDGSLNPMTSVAGQVKGSHLLPDGTLESVGGPGAPQVAVQSDTYIASGTADDAYTPEFTFHGFRYVEVTGLVGRPSRDILVGLRLNSDVERVGTFECSNRLLNRIQWMCDNTFLSNLFSVQSDCPHRERFGYGGDIAATSEAFMMNYNMDRFYSKVVTDFEDSALSDGMLTDTAPYVGIQYCGVAWGMAHPLLLNQLATYYGDYRLLEDEYPAAARWMDLASTQNIGGIVKTGLSDHESLAPTSVPVLVTPLYYQTMKLVDLMPEIPSHTDGRMGYFPYPLKQAVGTYRKRAISIKQAYALQFVDKSTGKVGDGTQADQAIALASHIVPDGLQTYAFQRLVESIEGPDKGHLTTGIFGTKCLLDVLSRGGRGDLAYKMVTQTTFPGWGYMLENGATTLWEHWQGSDNTYSQNHPMFGSVSQWLFQWIGGIEPSMNFAAIHPLCLPDLNEVKCSYKSIRGVVDCGWKREIDGIHLNVTIPVGMTAVVDLPGGNPELITESGQKLDRSSEDNAVFSFSRENASCVSCRVRSGIYRFVVKNDASLRRGGVAPASPGAVRH